MGKNAAVIRKAVTIGDELVSVGGARVEDDPIGSVISRLQHATHRPLSLGFRPLGQRLPPSVVKTVSAPQAAAGGSLAVACDADFTRRRWAQLAIDAKAQQKKKKTGAAAPSLTDDGWWFESVLQPINAQENATHYAEFVLCDAVRVHKHIGALFSMRF